MSIAHVCLFLASASELCLKIEADKISHMVAGLVALREAGGRLFILGVGGSAANASHACNDFRKLCGIEAYCPTDNVAELTARTNDDGWQQVFSGWLIASRMSYRDALLILSVGGGHESISANLIQAINLAKTLKAKVYGVIGDSTGYTAKHADIAVIVPAVKWKTPMAESFQALVWHCMVCHPDLQINKTVW